MQNKPEMLDAALKAAPPVTVSGMTVAGVGLPDLVLLLTALYTILQIVLVLRKLLAPIAIKADDSPENRGEQ